MRPSQSESPVVEINQVTNLQTETQAIDVATLRHYNSKEFLEDSTLVPNPHSFITIRGARENNLRNISIVVPKNRLVVFSGLSGSGKSSLVFDTIYAEGQRRYVESLSSYARQFLGLKEKPDVDSIDGLSPAISIDQKSTSQNPRSTVGTITEIYDYMRLIYAKIGHQHCAVCGAEIADESVSSMVERITKLEGSPSVIVLASIVTDQKGWHRQHIMEAKKNGFRRIRVDGKIMLLEEAEKLDLNKQQKHSIEIVIDRVQASPDNRIRILDSLEAAFKQGHEKAMLLIPDKEEQEEKLIHLNQKRACPNGHGTPAELEPRMFSFNSPHGACSTCSGLGTVSEIDVDLVIPNDGLSILEGCIRPFSRMSLSGGWLTKMFETLAAKHAFDLETPWRELSDKQKKVILYGDGKFEGVMNNLKRRYKESTSDSARKDIESYMNKKTCPDCNGARLKKESLAVTIDHKNIAEIVSMPINVAHGYFQNLAADSSRLSVKENEIAKMILKEVIVRLKFLVDVGLEYLNLSRSADTLSGGEAQRIRLATQIGSGLTGVLYILDEPSIGLHQKDNTRLLKTLLHLRDLGNTVLVVEHDEETMRSSDYLVDIGPKAGKHGGQVVACGSPAEVEANDNSPTGRFLAGKDIIEIPKKRREVKFAQVSKAMHNEKIDEIKDDWKDEINRVMRIV